MDVPVQNHFFNSRGALHVKKGLNPEKPTFVGGGGLSCSLSKGLGKSLVAAGVVTVILAGTSIFSFGLPSIVGAIIGIAAVVIGSTVHYYGSRQDRNSQTFSKHVVEMISPPPKKVNIGIENAAKALPAQEKLGIEGKSKGEPTSLSKMGEGSIPVSNSSAEDKVSLTEDELDLTTSDLFLTGSNLVQWGVVGASIYGVAPTITLPISILSSLGAEIATFCQLPKDASWLRKAMSIPVLSKALINYNPWISKISQGFSLFTLVQNSVSKLKAAWARLGSNPAKAAKVGAVSLFNLASGTAFAADSAGLISLKPKKPIGKCSPKNKEGCVRDITAGSSYTNGTDKRRNNYGKIVNKNHDEFTRRWGLKHEVSTDKDLLKDQCTAVDGSKKNCSNYWLKIPTMVKWLNEPKNPDVDEEWRILIDDDMLVTNMKIDPKKAIDQLRGEVDSSVILVKDPNYWPQWFKKSFGPSNWVDRIKNIFGYELPNPDEQVSINGGLWFIRKDAKARDFLNKVWETRNEIHDPNNKHCPTLGLCQNQDALHEQQGAASVLHRYPNFINNGAVSVIEPRDVKSDTRGHIALNTFHGHNNECYRRIREGWNTTPYIHKLSDNNPNAVWKKGDWFGQVAAIPVWGKQLPVDHNGVCIDDPNIPPTEVRLNKIQEAIDQIVRD